MDNYPVHTNGRPGGRPLKVAIYAGEIPASTFIERLIAWLAEEGCTVILFGKVSPGYRAAPGVVVCGTPAGKLARLLFVCKHLLLLAMRFPGDLGKLRTFIRDRQRGISRRELLFRLSYYLPVLTNRPDVFHIQWAKSVLTWEFLQEEFGIPLVVSLRGSQINIEPRVTPSVGAAFRQVFPRIRAFHAVSRSLAANAITLGADPAHIRVIYSALPEAMFGRQLQPFTGFPDDRQLNILSVGKYHWVKGGAYAIDAMRLLKDRGLSFRYTIIGGTSEEATFQVAQLGLGKEVRVTGRIPIEAVFKYLEQADVFLLSSVSEGIANSVLEAMAWGIPVISTDCGGMSELIENGKNGLLIPIRNAEAVADAIQDLLELEELRVSKMIEAARNTVEDRFRKARLVEEMLSLYRGL